jgi:hypothetical protein
MSETSEPSQAFLKKLMLYFPVGRPNRAGGRRPVADMRHEAIVAHVVVSRVSEVGS